MLPKGTHVIVTNLTLRFQQLFFTISFHILVKRSILNYARTKDHQEDILHRNKYQYLKTNFIFNRLIISQSRIVATYTIF